MSSSDRFEEKRNRLLELLDEAELVNEELLQSTNLKTIGENNKNDIERMKKNCKESLFSTALIAPFQSGKSTTTAAFADGQEVSPRGLGGGGIKTSACIIKVYNCISENQKARILWRTKEDLTGRILEVLQDTIVTIHNSIKISEFDIYNPNSIAVLKQAISIELDIYKEHPKNYNKDRLELLKYTMLAVHYLDDPKLKELMAKEYYTIDEVNKYIQFPRNLNEKWENLNPGNFTLAEAIYVFIEEVIIPIKSKLLEKTGTAIIDAPGLFVSIYDDKLAKNAMLDASAIFYLFTGEKQISQEDEKALTLIRDSGYDKKLFFGINFKKNPELIKEDDGIGKSIEASLRQLGFHNKQHQNILYFNAFLAMRAAQGKALLEGTLDEYTRQCIINDARKSQLPASTVEEAWLESTYEVMTIIRGKRRQELPSLGLCREAVNIVYEASNWYPTIDKINDYVFTHKAYALLVSQGCQPIINILSMTEQDLLSDEKEAEQEYEDRLQQYSEASAHLEQFIEESKSLKDYYISDLWDTILAGDYYDNVLIPAVKRVALISAPQIDKEVGVISTIADRGKKIFASIKNWATGEESDFNYIENKCTHILSTCFDNEMDTCSRKWVEGLSYNEKYNKTVKKDILQLMERTKDKWKQFKMDNDIFNRLSQLLPEMSGEIKKDMQSPRISLDALGQIKNVKLLNAFADFGMAFGSFIALGYVYVFLMPLDFIIPGAGIILSALAMGLVKGFQAITGQKEKRISALADNIEDHLLKEMSKSSQEIKQNLINGKGSTPGLNFIRKYYSLAYDAQLQEMHNKLTDDKNNSLRLYELSSKEREKVAREAKEFREEKINPLQEKVIEFKEEVVKLWSECD